MSLMCNLQCTVYNEGNPQGDLIYKAIAFN